MDKVKVAIIGSGNIGTDLMIKIDKSSSLLEVACVIGIDENSEGLAIARERGFSTTHEGIEGAQRLSEWENIKLVFDATSAYAHAKHAMICASRRKTND
jgi:acetaldehyde dehydrogenase